MPAKPVIDPQHPLLEPAELGETEAQPRVVAKRPEITQVVGDALPLQTQRAQPRGAGRRFRPVKCSMARA